MVLKEMPLMKGVTLQYALSLDAYRYGKSPISLDARYPSWMLYERFQNDERLALPWLH
jgi:hypothetical protein